MGKAGKHRTKRIRRTTKQARRYGARAKASHRLVGGRTGSLHHKKTPAKHHAPIRRTLRLCACGHLREDHIGEGACMGTCFCRHFRPCEGG